MKKRPHGVAALVAILATSLATGAVASAYNGVFQAAGYASQPAVACSLSSGSGYYSGTELVSTGNSWAVCPLQLESSASATYPTTYTEFTCFDNNQTSQGCTLWYMTGNYNGSYGMASYNGSHSGYGSQGRCTVSSALTNGVGAQLSCYVPNGGILYGVFAYHS